MKKTYGDKELKFKNFKIKLEHLSHEIDEKLFKQIFGHKIETLANKLINITNKVKSKIGKVFKNQNLFEEYSFKIYENDPYFYEHYEKKIQIDKNGCKYILFRIDNYFTECFQQQKLMKRDILTETLFLRKKDKKNQKKNLVVNLLELIQIMQKWL